MSLDGREGEQAREIAAEANSSNWAARAVIAQPNPRNSATITWQQYMSHGGNNAQKHRQEHNSTAAR